MGMTGAPVRDFVADDRDGLLRTGSRDGNADGMSLRRYDGKINGNGRGDLEGRILEGDRQ